MGLILDRCVVNGVGLFKNGIPEESLRIVYISSCFSMMSVGLIAPPLAIARIHQAFEEFSPKIMVERRKHLISSYVSI